MTNHVSATACEETPHVTRTTRTATIIDALRRRAQAVLNDRSIDPESRAIIRYALETNDPWLARLVRQADAGETIIKADGFSQARETSEDDSSSADDYSKDKMEALAEMICRSGDELATRAASLFVLMATLESAEHPKALANTVKHLAFNCCSELNLCGMVDAQIAVLERELFTGNRLAS